MPRAHQQRPQQDIAPLPDEAIEAVEPDKLIVFEEAWSPERAAVAQDGLGNAGVAALVDLGGDDAPEPAAGGFSWRPDPLEAEPGTLPTSDLVSAWPALQAQAPNRLAKVADGVAAHLPVLPTPTGLTAQDPAASPPPALSLPAPQVEAATADGAETLDAIQPAAELSPALDAALAHTATDLGAQTLGPSPLDGFIGEGLQLRPADGISLPELTAPELPPALDLSALTPALDARIAPHLAEAQAAEASMSSDAARLQAAHLRELDALQDQAIAQQLGLREGALAEASQARTAWQAELNQSAAAAMQQTAEARQQTLDAMQVETARVNEQAGAAGFVDGVYDTVREGARGMFDAAQGAAQRAIAASQALLSRMVQGYARLVQAVLQTTLAAWPGLADRWCGVIQGVVDRAQGAIDAVADGLRSASEAVLGGLADGLDVMLALGQATWVGALTLAGLVVTGDWEAIAEGLHNLLEAAKTAPPQFESAAWEELLGVDLDQPLSPAELAAAGLGASAEVLPGPPWTPENVGVDRVLTSLQLSPELLASLPEQGEVEFGFSNDPDRRIERILGLEEQAPTDDGLSPRERAQARWTLMKDGLRRWWAERWPAVLGAGVLGVAGFIGLNVLTAGAATAALPVMVGAMGAAMGLAGAVHIAGHVRDYLEKGWAGDAQGGGKALAKAGAAGAIELAMLATMKAGSAAMAGARAAGRGAKAAVGVARRGAEFVLERGRVLLKGLGDSAVGRGARSLAELGEALLARTRFRGFKLSLKGRRLRIWGKVNPWVQLVDQRLVEVDPQTPGSRSISDEELDDLSEWVRRDQIANGGYHARKMSRTWAREDHAAALVAQGSQGLPNETRTAKDIVRWLKRNRFEKVNTEGSHAQFKLNGAGPKVTVPIHGGDVKPGTLGSIRRQIMAALRKEKP
ncbi:MAG: type II toxin-antitoxin system HicA family toxin [Alphaproteobacteria bacterium]|nr:type II toxin-antitoxin system HicA family toxin [Alphaproteobacteria bacterium]